MRQISTALLLLVLVVLPSGAIHAQRVVTITIDPSRDNIAISPYIYGINWVHGGEELHPDWNLGSRRLGGNRLSSYNWEINASNSGNDCDASCRNQNDTWLTYLLPGGDENTPARLPKRFHEDSKALGSYSLVQLQAAGYVAGDRTQSPAPPAPSPRWKEVRFKKGTPLSLAPDTEDGYVYIDEQVNYLVETLGSSTEGGIQGYAIDNEPGLWYTTHPRMRGLSYSSADEVLQAEETNPVLVRDAKAKSIEVIEKSVAVAKAVKDSDPAAEVVGPAFWGFLDYYSLQEAPDWMTHKGSYDNYLEMYLDRMRQASQADGRRLLDVVDLHWYPQMGETPEKMMQAPRSLWDATYKEDSWIANDVLGKPIDLLATVKGAIDRYYPGTKLAITEFRFGDVDNGDRYYSGIAVADALGIFGRHGVYMAHYHQTDLDAPIAGYVAAAYKIFRNYDGARSTFGSTSVRASTSDVAGSSVYASVDPDAKLHLIVINKSMYQPLDGRFTVAGAMPYTSARVFAFDNMSSAITERAGIASIAGNAFSYTIPPLTVAHIILQGSGSGVEAGRDAASGVTLSASGPNPFSDESTISFTLLRASHGTLKLFNTLGEELATLADGELDAGTHTMRIDGRSLSSGAYLCRLQVGDAVRTVEVRVAR